VLTIFQKACLMRRLSFLDFDLFEF
jgi:hypothetical protein